MCQKTQETRHYQLIGERKATGGGEKACAELQQVGGARVLSAQDMNRKLKEARLLTYSTRATIN